MNSSNQETIKLTAPTSQYSIAPGRSLEIPVILANQGSSQDQLRIKVEGIPMVWVSTEHQVVLLEPGEQRQIILTIQPPAPPNVQIGRYTVRLLAKSVIDPSLATQIQFTLTIAGFEVKGRVGVLLQSLQHSVTPGDKLTIPVVMINQGLGADNFKLAFGRLPEAWASIPEPILQLKPGEIKDLALTVHPPRDSSVRAGRYPFQIFVTSQEAPDQITRIDCTLTVTPFIAFKASIDLAQPDQNLPARISIHNLSNIPASFLVTWNSREDTVAFEPVGPKQVKVSSGETLSVEYTARPTRRQWIGGETNFPYTVQVQASDQQTQTLESKLMSKGVVSTWAAIVGVVALLLFCLIVGVMVIFPGIIKTSPAATNTVIAPTATLSQIDQKPQLIERKWYLVAFNNTRSSPGLEEAFTLFNPNGTLIGYTGCRDLSANFQTNFNRINITSINLGPGICPESILQEQEGAMIAILRSARSFYVADTVLQIAGDAGFMNYSLFPSNRSETITPPQAVIRAVPQSQVSQVVLFDGSASTGQSPLVTWMWDFGDGTAASGMVVQHVYRNAGLFNVRLMVTDQNGQTGSTTLQIHILVLPTPTLTQTIPPPTATLPQPTPPPMQPTFTPVPTPEPPTFTPKPPPAPLPPQAKIAGPSQGFIGEPVTFNASASQPGSSPITSYSWSLGNGIDLPASPESNISAIYNRTGNYEVTVFISDANGLSSYATTRIHIDARMETDAWTLSTIKNQPLLSGTAITIQFKDGVLVGFSSCNTYHGLYIAASNDDGTYTIAIEQLTSSHLACPQDIMEQEQKYLTILQQASQVKVQENKLILESSLGRLDFYLIKAE